MTNKETIIEAIYRLKICAWAYGWDMERLKYEIKSFITDWQWNNFFERKSIEEELIQNLICDLSKSMEYEKPIPLIEENPKNRSYGNKYIKRKFR